MLIKAHRSLFLLFIFSFLITSCQTTKPYEKTTNTIDLSPCPTPWTTISTGIQTTHSKIPSRKITWHCVKIDLDIQNLQLVISPENTQKENSSFDLFPLKKFARKNKTIVAINTTPFDLGDTNTPAGIIKNKNNLISPPIKKYSALCFSKNDKNQLRAFIADSQTEDILSKADYAIGGFYTILEDSTIYNFEKTYRSRSACGISHNGRFLYLFSATPVFSMNDQNGLTYEECAQILKSLGCEKAMQLDGGHSTGLCINNKQVESPFFQRKIPAALGITIHLPPSEEKR